MSISTIQATFPQAIEKVWDVVVDVKNYHWRSDLSSTKLLSEKVFEEYTHDGFVTRFTITLCEPYQRWEFDMENENIKGHWIGVFRSVNGQTEVEFSEDVVAKKWIMNPFVKGYLKKQQALFIEDLKKKLEQ